MAFTRVLRSFWQDLRDAIEGKPHDYTAGSLGKAITVLSIPMILEMVMESVFIVVDVYFVEKLGADAVATVGLTEQVFTLVYAISIGFCMAAAAMVARRIGEKDPERAGKTAAQAILLGLFASLPITLIGFLFPRQILALMGGSPEVVEYGFRNVTVMLGGNLTVMLLYIINAIFRGAGDPSIAMRILWFANGINIILDPCLIFGYGPFPEMGVVGASVATNIGRGLGVCLQLYYLFSNKSVLPIRLAHFLPDWARLWHLLQVSWWGIVQWIVATSSMMALLHIIAGFGSEAVAGYIIGLRLLLFLALPAWGFSNAAATLVGQNLGAGKVERAERAVWMTSYYNMAFMLLVSIIFLTQGKWLVAIFTDHPEILRHGEQTLFIISFSLVFWGLGLVLSQAFNGAGDTTTPTVINFLCYWLFQIPLAWFLAVPMGLQTSGVVIAIAAAQGLLAPVGAWAFRRGTWKSRQL